MGALNSYLLSRGTQEGDTPLHVAAMEGHVEVAYWLLMEGADCRAVNQFGDTPLHFRRAATTSPKRVSSYLTKSCRPLPTFSGSRGLLVKCESQMRGSISRVPLWPL